MVTGSRYCHIKYFYLPKKKTLIKCDIFSTKCIYDHFRKECKNKKHLIPTQIYLISRNYTALSIELKS